MFKNEYDNAKTGGYLHEFGDGDEDEDPTFWAFFDAWFEQKDPYPDGFDDDWGYFCNAKDRIVEHLIPALQLILMDIEHDFPVIMIQERRAQLRDSVGVDIYVKGFGKYC